MLGKTAGGNTRHHKMVMKILVECYAGYRGEQEPRAFDRWLSPEHRYFKVRVDDGRMLVLRHDSATSEWEVAGMVGATQPTCGGEARLH